VQQNSKDLKLSGGIWRGPGELRQL